MSIKSRNARGFSPQKRRRRDSSSSSEDTVNDRVRSSKIVEKPRESRPVKSKPSYDDDEFDVPGRDELILEEDVMKNDSSDRERYRNLKKNEESRPKKSSHSEYRGSKSVDKDRRSRRHEEEDRRDRKKRREDKENEGKKNGRRNDEERDREIHTQKVHERLSEENERDRKSRNDRRRKERDEEKRESSSVERKDRKKEKNDREKSKNVEKSEEKKEENEYRSKKITKKNRKNLDEPKNHEDEEKSKQKKKRKYDSESESDKKKSKRKRSNKSSSEDSDSESEKEPKKKSKSKKKQESSSSSSSDSSSSDDENNSKKEKNKRKRDRDIEKNRKNEDDLRNRDRKEKNKKDRRRREEKERNNRDKYEDRRDARRRRNDSRSRSRQRSLSYDRPTRYDDNNRHRDAEEVVMGRYWNNGSEKRRPRVNQIYEEDRSVELGERFYGGAPKKIESEDSKNEHNSDAKAPKPLSQKKTVELLTSKTGGAYIPPAKLKMMQAEITDKSSAAYQRIAWEALKKSLTGYINKVNTSNIGLITRELLHENIIRGRGLLARAIIQAQATSPTFTPVYAALTAVINSKFAQIGELVVTRLAMQFKRAYRTNNKALCISSTTFIAHLVNQAVADEILALEILTLLVETPTNDSIEVAISFLKECGMRLSQVTKKCVESIFEMLRNILHEGQLDRRIQYMIEVMFQIRKDGFKDFEAVPEELDLVEEENQITHVINLVDAKDSQDILNVFKFDPDYQKNEDKYKNIVKDILESDTEDEEGDSDDEEEDSSEDEGKDEDKAELIIDKTETNLTALRRTIYLTIQSSLDFEECAHKLMKMKLSPGQEVEFCHMFLDCCAEMRTYDKFYGLLAGRFCVINAIYRQSFEQIFKDSYDTVHRLDTNKLRNISKFFAHLLFTDSMSWDVLSCVKLNEDDSTSSGRIFLKILFQELNEYMGLTKLNERVKDITLQEAFAGIFPRDNPRDTRFSINFFTAIGLGGLTDDLREHLKTKPKAQAAPKLENDDSSSDSSSSTSSSSSSDSDDD